MTIALKYPVANEIRHLTDAWRRCYIQVFFSAECSVIRKSQFEIGQLKRLIALSCILMALVMTGLEATHAHSDAAVSSNSRPCAICISIHTNAPTVIFHSLP